MPSGRRILRCSTAQPVFGCKIGPADCPESARPWPPLCGKALRPGLRPVSTSRPRLGGRVEVEPQPELDVVVELAAQKHAIVAHPQLERQRAPGPVLHPRAELEHAAVARVFLLAVVVLDLRLRDA